ncbi:glycoside hydrolase, partial [Brachyspira hyodysenteriae]
LYAKIGDVKTVTKLINGGYNGLDDRQKRFDRILKILQG